MASASKLSPASAYFSRSFGPRIVAQSLSFKTSWPHCPAFICTTPIYSAVHGLLGTSNLIIAGGRRIDEHDDRFTESEDFCTIMSVWRSETSALAIPTRQSPLLHTVSFLKVVMASGRYRNVAPHGVIILLQLYITLYHKRYTIVPKLL